MGNHTDGDDVGGGGGRGSSDAMYEFAWVRTELYVVMGILSFLSVMGTAGNALVMYVFAQKKDRLTSTVFILALAFVDFTTCLIVIPYTIYMEYVGFFVKYDVFCKIYQFLITSNIPYSALIMVAIAIDRYFCICHPFLHAMTLRRAKIMIFCLAMCAAGMGVIVALMYGVYDKVPLPNLHHLRPNGSSSSASFPILTNISSGGKSSSGSTDSGFEDKAAVYSVQQVGERAMGIANYTNEDIEGSDLEEIRVYSGQCRNNTIYLDQHFQWYYQKFYTAMYLVCLIIVIVLYILIYNSVLSRRTKRQKQKSKSLPMVQTTTNDNNGNSTEETLLTTMNGDVTTTEIRNGASELKPDEEGVKKEKIEGRPHKKDKKEKDKHRRKSTRKDRNRVANLKTAAMLFVVTIVFILTFLPAFLMALELIPYSMTVFYMYFANNVANPVIYSFMNKNFRDDLKKLLCGR